MIGRLCIALVAGAALLCGPARAQSDTLNFDGTGSKTATLDTYRVNLTAQPQKKGDPLPVMNVDAPGMPHLRASGGGGFTAAASVRVLDLDPQSKHPVVALVSFSGGAHCCTERDFFIAIGKVWKHVNIEQDGEPEQLSPIADLDGDGVADILSEDRAFSEGFDPHGESAAPALIYNLAGGVLVDVTRVPTFAPFLRRDLVILHAGCLTHVNGMCAPFVAEASLLGLHDWAWKVMLANYDAKDTFSGENFPTNLKAFLTTHHYYDPAQPIAAQKLTPSFACAAGQSAARARICASPTLADYDETLAATYFTAHRLAANSKDKSTADKLKADQTAWLAVRDASTADDSGLEALYDARIAKVASMGRRL